MTSVVIGASIRDIPGAAASAVTVCGPAVLYWLSVTNQDTVDRYFRLMDGVGVGSRPTVWPTPCFSFLIPAGATVPMDFGVHGMAFQQALSIGCSDTPAGAIFAAPIQYVASVAGI